MTIKMPELTWGQCDVCQNVDINYFNYFAARDSCVDCDAAPIHIFKVEVKKAVLV